jgi:alpha-tubulin suppressor-like RCC1 family protein
MSMSTLKELVEAVKTRSKAIAETTSGTVSGSTAGDMVYIGKTVEAIAGADALLQLFDEANEPSKIFDYADATNGVWSLGFDDIVKPVLKFTEVTTPTETELTVVVPNRAFYVVIKNSTSKSIRVQYSGASSGNSAVIKTLKTGFVSGDYTATGTNQVQHIIQLDTTGGEGGTEDSTVLSSRGDMLYRVAGPSGTTFTAEVQKINQSGSDYFQFKLPGDTKFRLDVNFNIFRAKTYIFDVSDSSMSGHNLRFSLTEDGTHASPTAGTELLDIAPTDGTNDITYTGTSGNTSASVTITMPDDAETDVFYPYCSQHSGMGKNSQFNVSFGGGDTRLPLGGAGTVLTADNSAGKPTWDYVGKVGAYHYRLDADLSCRVADPRAPGYPGTSTNGLVRDDFSIQGEIMDSTAFPLHANKGIWPGEIARHNSGPYYGASAIVQFSDGANKTGNWWGGSTSYRFGNASNNSTPSFSPTVYYDQSKGYGMTNKHLQDTNIIQVTGAYDSSYMLDDRGQMWAAGYNNVKQLGNNSTTTEYRWIPVQFPSSAGAITQYAVGQGGSSNCTMMALDENGKVWGWGYNSDYQVSSSTTSHQGTPTEVSALSGKDIKAIAVSCSDYPTCYALSGPNDGYKLYSWGYNSYGAVGNGTTTHVSVGSPHRIQPGSNKKVVKFRAGGWGSYGGCLTLNEDGQLYYNGNNNGYQAGDGSSSGDKLNPTLVSTFDPDVVGKKVIDMWICHDYYGSRFATTDNGDFYRWGPNNNGQTGMGTTSGGQATPSKDSSITWVSKVYGNSCTDGSCYGQTMLIAHDNEEDFKNKVFGTLYVTGYNNYANPLFGVSTGVTVSSFTPVPLPLGYQGKVRDIGSLGHSVTSGQTMGWMVLMMDGTMWTCGMESTYMLGRHQNESGAHHLQLRGSFY